MFSPQCRVLRHRREGGTCPFPCVDPQPSCATPSAGPHIVLGSGVCSHCRCPATPQGPVLSAPQWHVRTWRTEVHPWSTLRQSLRLLQPLLAERLPPACSRSLAMCLIKLSSQRGMQYSWCSQTRENRASCPSGSPTIFSSVVGGTFSP